MEELLQHLLNGLLLGGTYALLGIGLTLIFGLMNVVNFAHGEFYTLGAYVTYAALALSGLPFVLAVLVAIAAGMLLGATAERVLLRPLGRASIDTVMLVMIGLWITMQNGELLAWGGVAKAIEHPFPSAPIGLGPVSVAPIRIFVLGAVLFLILGSHLLINRTRMGTAMRATFQDRETAALMGIDVARIHTVTFAFGSGLAAAAGALLGSIFLVYPSMGDLASLKAFCVVILGGLGNFTGALLGGLILGLAEEFGAGYISSGYRDAVGFVIIILVLIFRPSGLFARAERAGMSAQSRRAGAGLVLLALLVTTPGWVTNPYYLHIAIMAGIFSVLALSMNLLLGYTGQLSLGHAAFFGIGAYASALLTLKLEWPFLGGFAAATVLPGVTGYIIGRLALRLRGAYFVLVTISFAGVVSLVSVNWMELTNGPLGLPGIPPAEIAGLAFRSKRAVYYLVLVVALLAWVVCHRLVHSPVGRAFLALRENEALGESVGIDATHYLVLATVVSAAMAGAGGSLYVHYTRLVSPEVFLFSYTVTWVIMVVAGGKGTLAGPIVGALIFTALPEVLREVASWQWQMFLYGLLLILTLFFLPQGIVPALAGGRRR